jgi:GNAT superfamily N-acetyltransferase
MTDDGPQQPVGGLAVRAPSGIELRPLGRSDLADAIALARQCRGLPPLDDVAPLAPRLDALLDSADVTPFVAVDDGQTVGLGVLEFRRRLNMATFEGAVTDLFVVPGARGRGVGRALLNALVAEWRLRGGHRLQAKAADGPAAGLYASAGLEEWMLDFVLEPLVEPPAADVPGLLIRPLGEDDFEQVTALISQFGPHRTPATERMDAVRRTYATLLREVAAGGAFAALAERDGAVVGVYAGRWQQPFWTDAAHAWLADLMIDERQRGHGIGRALLAHAVVRAREAGAARMSLESGPGRAEAHGLYRSTGFAETGRTWLLRNRQP